MVDSFKRSIKQRKKIQITKIRNERGNITTEPADIKSVIREHVKQHYTNTFYGVNEIDQFFEKHKLANSPVMTYAIEWL